MNDAMDSTAKAGGEPGARTREGALRLCVERLRALRSAWGVIAPSRISGERQAIAHTGRALNEGLTQLLENEPANGDEAALAALEARLDELEREMRDVALEVPVAQLRSTLPERVAVDRRGVLDLLDLILGAEVAGLDGTRARIPALDYLITLLCTGGDLDPRLQDPVTLTPRLHGLCERSEATCEVDLPELENEFFAAADMHQADVREEVTRRTLRRRKMELGQAFFVPGVLRAIMTYNTSMLQRIDEEVTSSQDWGSLPRAEVPGDGSSVFESAPLPKLAAALRRRAADAPPSHDPLDRIAWCLDLAYLTDPERESVLSEQTGHRGELMGTTILVGLLLRSAVVLDDEYPAVGIAPDQLSGAWTRELEKALQQEVNRRIASDGYDAACLLTDLRSRFLSSEDAGGRPMRIRRPAKSSPPVREAAPRESTGENAQQLASAAVESLHEKAASEGRRSWRWDRIGALAVVGLVAVGALALVNFVFFGEGRVVRAELEQLSPFLSNGRRSGDGIGTAFAGTLDDRWSALEPAEQVEAADALVQALRQRGVREIMIFDDERQLRIQALGSQPPSVIPVPAGR